VLVAVRVNVGIGRAAFLGQRLGARHLKQFNVQRAVHQHRYVGRDGRYGKARLHLEAEYAPPSGNRGVEIAADDFRAMTGKHQRTTSPDAAAKAGDDGHFVLKTI
jgi:hypothetical protein